ncbi:hypothetical protein ACO2Q3_00230 [Caulobacter sp. KR2-114]|uniref:hypothetical protein n=1 Tax=Caulobacter sp. KR2-114 TaxID=3400912 RepID=UPI003C0C8E47
MSQIRKFSFVYDAAEDRLACDTELTDDATARLWLTQRFCRGFVLAILPILERSVATDEAHQALVQSWEQVAALSDFGQTPAVETTAQSSVGLVHSAHLTPLERGIDIALEFKALEAGADGVQSMALAFPEVRQMLSAMHSLHLAAGWPVDGWPAWITDPAALAAPADSVN